VNASIGEVAVASPVPNEVTVTRQHPGQPSATASVFTVGEIQDMPFYIRIPPKTTFPMKVCTSRRFSPLLHPLIYFFWDGFFYLKPYTFLRTFLSSSFKFFVFISNFFEQGKMIWIEREMRDAGNPLLFQ